jgi:hypothetical protein
MPVVTPVLNAIFETGTWTNMTVPNVEAIDGLTAASPSEGGTFTYAWIGFSSNSKAPPQKYGNSNSFTMRVTARRNGTVGRTHALLVQLVSDGGTVLGEWTTPTLTSAMTTYEHTLTLTSALTKVGLRVTVQEGTGMASTGNTVLDAVSLEVDYNEWTLTGVTISPTSGLYTVGTSSSVAAFSSVAVGTNSPPNDVWWSINDTSIATLNTGLNSTYTGVHAISPGTTTLVATHQYEPTAVGTAQIDVLDIPDITNLKIQLVASDGTPLTPETAVTNHQIGTLTLPSLSTRNIGFSQNTTKAQWNDARLVVTWDKELKGRASPVRVSNLNVTGYYTADSSYVPSDDVFANAAPTLPALTSASSATVVEPAAGTNASAAVGLPAITLAGSSTATVPTFTASASAALAPLTSSSSAIVLVPTPLTLTPDGTLAHSGVVNEIGASTNLHQSVADTPSSSDGDTTYLVNSGRASGSVDLNLSNTPFDFSSMTTLTLRVRARKAGEEM